MITKKVLIVGAGPAQYKGIAKAKEMSLYTIVVDVNPDAPGMAIADIPLVIDVKDIPALIQIARKYKIDGVFSISSEVSVRTVAAISEELKLPGISQKTANNATDKGLMREKFLEYHLPSPQFKIVYSLAQAIEAIEEIGFPVVIKPADNAGSRGVTLVLKGDDVNDAFESSKNYSRQGKVLVESFMEGLEVSVEAFVYKNNIKILALSDKIRTPPPYLLDTTVIFPSKYPPETLDKIRTVAINAIKALGIDNGPIHMELMMTKEGPKIVELAARGPGFKVFTEIIPYVTGVDVVEGVIKLALGEEPDLNSTANRSAVLKFIGAKPGRIKEIKGISQIKNIKGVYDFEIYLDVNDVVRPLTCGDDRIGHIIAFSDTRDNALKIIEMAEKMLRIEVE